MRERPAEMPSLERLAERLILADPAEPSSLVELIEVFEEFARWARGEGVAREVRDAAAECVHAANALASANESASFDALTDLGRCFERMQRMVMVFSSDMAQVDGAESTDAAVCSAHVASTAAASFGEDASLVADFVTRATELLESADENLVVLERSPERRDLLDDVFRAFHTLKGMGGFLALDLVQATAHAAESVLDAPRHGTGVLEAADMAQLFEAVDELKRQVSAVCPTPAAGASVASTVESSATSHIRTTIRVDQRRLDGLLDAIGEMVIAESMASEAARLSGSDLDMLQLHLARLDKLARGLQELATSLRMMPLGPTFRRMGRVVRDVSLKAGKQVEFVVFGEDTELDKEMVDRISDPLIHLLRNAVDHGIELPDVRVAAGKDPVGRVTLRAYHQGGTVVIEVSDDGGGIDETAVTSRAHALGLTEQVDRVNPDEMLELILSPGFSTAEDVTDVSGRGVGMDVVKRTVDDLAGQIEVSSAKGTGVCFTIRLPLTLAIIDGMVVRVGSERYIIPNASIQRSIRPLQTDVSRILDRGSILSLSDGVVPLIYLGELFGSPGTELSPERAIVIICEVGNRRVGLVACELLGSQQAVVKSLGDGIQNVPGVAGAAIMSDGRVGLVLDAAGLVRIASAGGGE